MFVKSFALLAITLLWVAPCSAQWTYKTFADQMGDTPTRVAHVRSTNFHQLPFPYHGKTYATLILRYKHEHDIAVRVDTDRGQIICRRDCETRVRFDDEAARDYDTAGAADHSPEVVFLEPEPDFIERAMSAKRIRVELLMYQAGSRVFEFSVRGLQWPPPMRARQ